MLNIQNSNKKTVVYIGDFDFKNQNVQSHLVNNNATIFNKLGFRVIFIGINRKINNASHLDCFSIGINEYIELPYTFNIKGIFTWPRICKVIIKQLEHVANSLQYVITYQCPTYAFAIRRIGNWCKQRKIAYLVNCADIPVFLSQPFLKRIIMKKNWNLLHRFNKRYANGVIAVTNYIKDFYKKDNCSFIIIPPLCLKQHNSLYIDDFENKPATFVYVGTPFVKNGKQIRCDGMKDRLDYIIDLFLLLHSSNVTYSFQIIGISLDEYLVGVPRHKNTLEKIKEICFYGEMPHDNAIKFIQSADYSINYRDDTIMSRAGFSTKIVESISFGTPIVSNKTGDIDIYLKKGREWYCLSDDVDANIKLLQQLCSMPAYLRKKKKIDILNETIFEPSRYVNDMFVFLSLVDKSLSHENN